MSEIMLRIKGTQIQGDEEDVIDFSTLGNYERRGTAVVLTYTETDEDTDVTTEVCVDGGVITMQKSGSLETQMVFEEQKTYTAEYITPFGNIDVMIYPTMVNASVGDDNGKIELEYIMTIAGSEVLSRINMQYSKGKTGKGVYYES